MAQLSLLDPLNAPISADRDGIFRVSGTRVRLDTVINAYNMGFSAEDIVSKYPSVPLPDVYVLIGYYLQHREEVDAYLAERSAEIENATCELQSAQSTADIRARLLARKKNGA